MLETDDRTIAFTIRETAQDFFLPFHVTSGAELTVVEGVTTLTDGVDYNVTPTGERGALLVMVAGTAGAILTITRDLPITQPETFAGSNLSYLEGAMDRRVMTDQAIEDTLDAL